MEVTKAALGSMTTDGGGGADLPTFANAASEFFQVAAQGTIAGRLSGLRRMPLRTRVVGGLGGSVASWVAQGQAKPISNSLFFATKLEPLKIVAVTIASVELLSSSDPAAESIIRADLLRAAADASDTAFIDPSNTGVPGATPASVTAGLDAATSSGTDTEALKFDLLQLVERFAGDLAASYFAMHPSTAVAISGPAHPDIGARGGALLGVPVLTSRSAPVGTIALIDPGGVAYGEGVPEARILTQGDVLMSTTPAMSVAEGSPEAPTPAQLVSLWQTNSVGILIGRAVNWETIRPGAVAVLVGVTFGSP